MLDVFLYLFILLSPLPLLVYVFSSKHYLKCLYPFVAFCGIYLFTVVGAYTVIANDSLYTPAFTLTLVSLIVGFYVFYTLLGLLGRRVWIEFPMIEFGYPVSHLSVMGVLWLWCFFIFYLYVSRNGLPVLFHINWGHYTDIYAERGRRLTNLAEGTTWYNLAFFDVPIFSIVYSYVLLVLNKRILYRVIFLINVLIAFFFLSLNGTKSPYLYAVIPVFLVMVVLEKKRITVMRLLGVMATAGIPLLVIMRLYLMDRSFLKFLLVLPHFFYERIFVVYSEAHAHVLRLFPDKHDFFHGLTFSNPGGVFPYTPVNISRFLGLWINGADVQNYSPPSFSEGYANFGYPGFFLIVLLMFAQILTLTWIFRRIPKNPLSITFYFIIAGKMLLYSIEPIQLVVPEEFVLLAVCCFLVYHTVNRLAVLFYRPLPHRPISDSLVAENKIPRTEV